MAMDFWEAQRRARKKTTLYVVIFIAMTLVVAVLAELAFQVYRPGPVFVGPLFLLVTFGVALFQYLIFRSSGGAYVAESVGGERVALDTQDPQARQLLNIVEEISIASGIPTPPVYIIPANQINAFAAGTSHEKAVIAVTRGSLNQLSRDELQGVIAHEFGHIRNLDMVISLRLAAMVMGFFFLLYIALRILQFSGLSGGSRSRGSDKKSGNPVALIALILLIAGAIAWFFGSILKASVSRQREYLADADAVQFTRHPEGIAGALRKISHESEKDMPKAGMAFSHMYLDSHHSLESLFATHPPLEKRIAAIEGKNK